LRRADACFDVLTSEDLFGMPVVVGSATNADVCGFVRAAERSGLDVVELQERAGRAALSMLVDERALLAVSREYLALDGT
jgi:hypothetical protein